MEQHDQNRHYGAYTNQHRFIQFGGWGVRSGVYDAGKIGWGQAKGFGFYWVTNGEPSFEQKGVLILLWFRNTNLIKITLCFFFFWLGLGEI